MNIMDKLIFAYAASALNGLHFIDYLIIFSSLAGSLYVGFYFSKNQKSTRKYFAAEGKIPAWAIGMSILATLISSVTFLAYPGEGYSNNWILLVQGLMVPVVLLTIIWGSSYLWIKVAVQEVGPFTLVTYRLLLGVLFLMGMLLLQRPAMPSQLGCAGSVGSGQHGIAICINLLGRVVHRLRSGIHSDRRDTAVHTRVGTFCSPR